MALGAELFFLGIYPVSFSHHPARVQGYARIEAVLTSRKVVHQGRV
jgi:hypothetical protein